MEIAEALAFWDPEPGWLDTASYGLPPRPAFQALQEALENWRSGRTSWEVWDGATQCARESFARMVGVGPGDIAVGAQVSQLLAPVAAAIPAGSRVLVPDGDFASTLYPWLVHADRGVAVSAVPLDAMADRVGPDTDVVTFSLVQSSTGQIADFPAIVASARAVGALVAVDATQACGWLPFDAALADVVVAGAYKWLMGPRGTAFAYLSQATQARTRPLAAGWYAAQDVHASYYGPPMRLAGSARRFDISPAWFAWVGTAPAMELVERIGIGAIHDHDVALANRFLTGLGRPPGRSAIVTVEVPNAEQRLAAAGVRAAVRAGRVRASFHVYTTDRDVDLALDALCG